MNDLEFWQRFRIDLKTVALLFLTGWRAVFSTEASLSLHVGECYLQTLNRK
jgi:hypothetical protein